MELIFQDRSEHSLCRRLTVDEEYTLQLTGNRFDPFHELLLISVGAQLIQRRHFGSHLHRFTENVYLLVFLDEPPSESVSSLEAGEENKIAPISYSITQVMKN